MDLILTGVIVLGAGIFIFFSFRNILISRNPCEKCMGCEKKFKNLFDLKTFKVQKDENSGAHRA